MFGCGEAGPEARFAFAAEVAQATFSPRVDRLRHNDSLQRDVLDWLYGMRIGARGVLLAGLGLVGVVGSLLASMGSSGGSPGSGAGRGDVTRRGEERIGRLHALPSTSETVRLGVFDATLPNVLEIDSGDVVVYPATWSHFLNRLQPRAVDRRAGPAAT